MRLADKSIINQSKVVGAAVSADFDKKQFDILFRDKGLNVIHQKAIQCSCKSEDLDSYLSNCTNCGGRGWFYVNPIRTRMIITGLNLERKYDEDGRTDIGIVNVSSMHEDKLGYMDMIVLTDAESTHHEIIYPVFDSLSDRYHGFTIYDINEIEFVGQYVGTGVKLKRLVQETDFIVSNNIIEFNENFEKVNGTSTNNLPSNTKLEDINVKFTESGVKIGDVILNNTDGSTAKAKKVKFNSLTTSALVGGTNNKWIVGDTYTITIIPQISVRYRHNPVFYIWDVYRDSLVSLEVAGPNKRNVQQLAVKAIAKRAHLIIEGENLLGSRLLDNSFISSNIKPSKLTTIIRNTSAQSIFDTLTTLQRAQIAVISNGIFDITFDTTFE